MQSVRKIKSGGAAPSGIPVASTTNILITCPSESLVNTPFTRYQSPPFAEYQPSIPFSTNTFLIFNFGSTGSPGYWEFVQPDGDGGYNIISSNISTNGNYIPTSGWLGQSITITAA